MHVHLVGATSSPCCVNYCSKKQRKTTLKTSDQRQRGPSSVRSTWKTSSIRSPQESKPCLIGEVCDLLLLGDFKLTKRLSKDKHVLAVPTRTKQLQRSTSTWMARRPKRCWALIGFLIATCSSLR